MHIFVINSILCLISCGFIIKYVMPFDFHGGKQFSYESINLQATRKDRLLLISGVFYTWCICTSLIFSRSFFIAPAISPALIHAIVFNFPIFISMFLALCISRYRALSQYDLGTEQEEKVIRSHVRRLLIDYFFAFSNDLSIAGASMVVLLSTGFFASSFIDHHLLKEAVTGQQHSTTHLPGVPVDRGA